MVAVVADVGGIEAVEELEGTVVQGQAQDAHVVRVHDAVAETDGLPVRHQRRRTCRDGGEQGGVGLGFIGATGVVVRDDEVGQLPQLVMQAVVREVLEMAKTNEAGCHAGDHGGRFGFLAPHGGGRAGDAQRAGGGHAQAMQGLAGEELPDGRAQHGAPVAHARIRRGAGSLELKLHRAGGRAGFAEQQGPPVAQLAGPHAELMPAVDGGDAGVAAPGTVAGEDIQRFVAGQPIEVQAELACQALVAGHPVRAGQGARRPCGREGRSQAVKAVEPGWPAGQRGTGGRVGRAGGGFGGSREGSSLHDSIVPLLCRAGRPARSRPTRGRPM